MCDPCNPKTKRFDLIIKGLVPDLDVAVLESKSAHFFRLTLCGAPLNPFTTAYTVQRIEVNHISLHKGRVYNSPHMYKGYCDSPSDDFFSGSPVISSKGQVIGMLLGRMGTVNAAFITTEGLTQALSAIDQWPIRWNYWGIKPYINASNYRKRTSEPIEVVIGPQKRLRVTAKSCNPSVPTSTSIKAQWTPSQLVKGRKRWE